MSKRTPFLFFIILLVSIMPLPRADALGIGPPSFELDLKIDGSNSTTVYLLSDGLEGELTIGRENLPFRVEPSRINMSKEDNYRPVELTFYGNETLEPGIYEGMVTFTAYTGGFVALGIKIRAKVNLLDEFSELQDESERETEERPAPLPEIETTTVTEPIPYSEIANIPEFEPTMEENHLAETKRVGYTPHIMGGATITALALIVWWKRR